jgi:hypothetical protein
MPVGSTDAMVRAVVEASNTRAVAAGSIPTATT